MKTNVFSKKHLFYSYSDRKSVFIEELFNEVEALGENSCVLDVGCGEGIERDHSPQKIMSTKVKHYWGVEPDGEVKLSGIFERIWRSNIEDADIPPASVDLAYSYMVMEHLDDPDAFFQSLASILRPGGVFISMTVNRLSTFARISRFCGAMRIQELVLRIARGKELVEKYHYPAYYLANEETLLRKCISQAGFSKFECVTLEAGEWLVYFPKGLKWCGHILSYLFQRNPKRFTWLIVRLQR